jgi:hypothetical protein
MDILHVTTDCEAPATGTAFRCFIHYLSIYSAVEHRKLYAPPPPQWTYIIGRRSDDEKKSVIQKVKGLNLIYFRRLHKMCQNDQQKNAFGLLSDISEAMGMYARTTYGQLFC